MAKGQNKDVLYRVEKFEVKPDVTTLMALMCVSNNLREVWNTALVERQQVYNDFIAPIYERMKEKDADSTALRKELKIAWKEHAITLFDQINALTPRRQSNQGFSFTPRNWQEETLDTLDGAYKSFMMLRKNGDPDARPPRMRDENDFSEIPGRYGFAVRGKTFEMRSSLFSGGTLVFPIPDYQVMKLGRALKLKKFTLYRDPHNTRQKGRYWISIAYEMAMPETKRFVPDEAVYVSVGASSLGIVSPHGEEVVKLWRPDKYWEPKIASVEARLKICKKGTRKWERLYAAKRRMQILKARQQKQSEREVVARKLLSHGDHFVVSDIVVRSKSGKLADSSKPERGGKLGLNWSAQNTGNLARLVSQLDEKAKERGGSVRKHKAKLASALAKIGHENKIEMAENLRGSFLTSFSVGIVEK